MSTLMVGQTLYGFCGGWFGRDSYHDKRIEAVGVDWVVARDDRGEAWFTSGPGIHARLVNYTTPETAS